MTGHEAATYAVTEALLASLIGGGVTDVVISPGSRSTPLVVTAAAMSDLCVHIVLDERSAGFVALGIATASARPVALICTSGSAAANYFPAVVEANRNGVTLVVLTADRPPGFLERDASQSIDQIDLYGSHVARSVALPAAHQAHPVEVASEVQNLLGAARTPARPVHVNCPFDQPLEPPSGWAPMRQIVTTPLAGVPAPRDEEIESLRAFLASTDRGVIVAGPRRALAEELDAVVQMATRRGWPVLADPLSGFRTGGHAGVVTGMEVLLRSDRFVAGHRPEAVIRLGGTPTGRASQQWIEAMDVPILLVDPDRRWTAEGPEIVLRGDVEALFASVALGASDDGPSDTWARAWQAGEERVIEARRAEMRNHPGSELSITRTVIDSDPSLLWAASSMPIRHVDAMLGQSPSLVVRSNRGANGIDGTIASATGAALGSGEPATLLMGELAFLHDAGSLTAATELGVDLTIVVIDNRGGAVFSMLPVVSRDEIEFTRLFTTPHTRDIAAIASGYGARADRISTEALALALSPGAGVRVLVVDADPADTHEAYRRMVEA